MALADYRAREFSAQDGLRLYFRDYGEAWSTPTPVLCLAGLTRNSADFHDLARMLAPERRVLALDLRGRGRSARDPDPTNYQFETYLNDIAHLLTLANCHRVVVVGTSLGGILAMGLGAARPTALAGVVLNDDGPVIDGGALANLGARLGRLANPRDLDDAARLLRESEGAAFPDFDDEDWRREAERRYRPGPEGRMQADYDPTILDAMASFGPGRPLEFWDQFMTLEEVPTLAIRGGLSEIVSQATFEEMARRKPDLRRLTVARRGHAPRLDEPEVVSALTDFLATIDRAT